MTLRIQCWKLESWAILQTTSEIEFGGSIEMGTRAIPRAYLIPVKVFVQEDVDRF
jgi:hypothetical protein